MDCKRTFRSRYCFAKHKAMKSKQHKSICHLVYNCGKCGLRIVGNKKNHVCPGQRKCRNCKEIVGPNHQCYIQSYSKIFIHSDFCHNYLHTLYLFECL